MQPFEVMQIIERANELDRQGADVIHLEVGEPKFPLADVAKEAGQRYLERGQARYTEAAGIPALREAIAKHYESRFGVEVDPSRIVVTNGASAALQLAMAATMDPGQRLLTADPAYPCNRQIAAVMGCPTDLVPTRPQDGFQLTPDQIESHWHADTGAVLVASPSNPTGTALAADQLERIHSVVQARGAHLLVDEIYQSPMYSQAPTTALEFADPWVINSFSKYFGMTGLRLGWLVCPPGQSVPVINMAQHLFISPSGIAQEMALACFAQQGLDEFERRRDQLALARDFLVSQLSPLGFELAQIPEGAYYLFFDVSKVASSSQALATRLLEEAHVATTPGYDFGPTFGQSHIRVAYVDDLSRLQKAVDRIKTCLG